jgi:carbon monoxide dehydrogenase subunit G
VTSVELERDVAAPIERVWRVFTDLERAAEDLSGVSAIERLDGGPFREGTSWRETRRMYGRDYTETLTVTACRAPERYVVEADSQGAHYATEFVFTPVTETATRVRVRFDVEGRTAATRLVDRLLGGMVSSSVRKTLRKDLDELAAVAESSFPR